MQTIVVFAALICAAAAQTVVKSDRLGGNFAYSTASNPAWAVAPAWGAQWAVQPYAANWNGLHWNSAIAAGTPASTYKTVAGVSPIWNQWNGWAY